LVAIVLTMMLLLSSSGAVFAKGTDTQQDYDSLIKSLDQYVKVVDNQFEIDIPKKVAKKIGPEQLDLIKQRMAESNLAIKSNNLTIDLTTKKAELLISDQQIMATLASQGYTQAIDPPTSTDIGPMLITNGGVTKVVFFWGGFDLYLSSYMVKYICVGGIAAVAVLVTLVPGIGWTLAGGIAGAIAAEWAGDQTYYAIVVRHYWGWPTPVSAMWLQ